MTSLPSLDRVHAQIESLTGGRRRVRFVRVAGIALFWSLCVVALLAWFVAPATVGLGVLGAIALAAVVGLVVARLAPVDPVAIAKRYDDEVGTKDLLSSSVELGATGGTADAFVAVVREEAASATGRDTGGLYPVELPHEARWAFAPLGVTVLALAIGWWNQDPPPPPTNPALVAAMAGSADVLEQLFEEDPDLSLSDLDSELIDRMKNLAEALRKAELTKSEALAEIARLASQLDKERIDRDDRKLSIEKNAARLAKGEDLKDARRDMDAGRYREAANKVKKKLEELEKKLREAIEKKAGKLEIDKLKERIQKMRELLAVLEELDALGGELGFLVETLEMLERIEGELGELGEFDGELFDEVELGRGPRQPRDPQEDGDRPKKLFAMPSNDAGHGHSKKVLGDARRSLSEREEHEARLREGKGKSSFGQVRTANDGSRSRTAYEEAFLNAQRAADDVIHRQNIPAGYRNFIRRYFELMQPDDPRGEKPRDK